MNKSIKYDLWNRFRYENRISRSMLSYRMISFLQLALPEPVHQLMRQARRLGDAVFAGALLYHLQAVVHT